MAQCKGTYGLSPIPGTHMMERDPAYILTLQINVKRKKIFKNLKVIQEGTWRDDSVCLVGESGFGS